ncbi:hypothetical protein [Desulforamulus hydrothermalis]|uniref:Uncharacterized protein n=1 Tax=Desulforamulus hydrothermalis Lam5 = DSM 18033 TaxID=1121428 RepID=K8DYH7_9FIRM|nr:hypothetical protein [Desulforamulus hydrothermalis]CCO06887.1 hypothetical protein DESHY_10047 [Desulforamulus hydrothermalis Lam5 = DSM 18033]CCO07922.1 hypothetical protein DESHY_160046 [Desulforamulus hydrothermalis Lam5 = DSM 18033]
MKHKLFSATDFVDAVKHFKEQDTLGKPVYKDVSPEIKPLDETDRSKLKTKPQVRDIKIYQQIMNGGLICQE